MTILRTIATVVLVIIMTITCEAGNRRGNKRLSKPVPDPPVLCVKPEIFATPSDEPYFNPENIKDDVAEPVPVDNRIKGIDVSHHQGEIDWSRVARDPQVNYCFIKATESISYVDRRYHQNLREARANGVKVGAYHFFSHKTSPVQQAQNMIATVRLSDQDIIPMIDVETINKRSDVHAFRQRLRTFLQVVEKHYGIRPLIYTGENFYNRYLAGHFTEYRFMIAKYREPAPQLFDPQTKVLMWQYSCTGTVDGIYGDCDQSCFLKDYNINDILLR